MQTLFNKALFKEQIKRFWTLSAITSFIYLLFVVMPIFRHDMYRDSQYRLYDLIRILYMKNPVIIATTLILPLIVVGMLFSYLFQGKASVTILSYPIKRDSLWFTNVVSGFVLMIIPIIVITLALLVVINIPIYTFSMNELSGNFPDYIHGMFQKNFNYKDLINILTVVAFFFKLLLSVAFYYSVFILCAHICGSSIIYVLVSAFLPFIPGGIVVITSQYMYYYLIGISTFEFVGDIFKYTNPIVMGVFKLDPSHVICYLILIIILLTTSFYCNRIRKQENTGDSVVFKSVKNILIFSLSITGMFLVGYFFIIIYQNFNMLYAGMVVGFLIFYYVAQMFAEKSFNIFKKATKALIKYGGITIAIFLSLLCIAKFDLLGYEKYVPKPEDVQSVSLLYQYYNNGDPFITDMKTIEQTTEVHHKLLEHKKELRESFLEHFNNYNYKTSKEIIYKLKNGKTITRHYYVPYNLVKSTGLFDLLATDQVILSQNGFINKPENIDSISIEFANKSVTIDNSIKILSFTQELKKDLVLDGIEFVYNSIDETNNHKIDKNFALSLSFAVKNFSNDYAVEYYTNGRRLPPRRYIQLYSCDNTNKWLISNGYGDILK